VAGDGSILAAAWNGGHGFLPRLSPITTAAAGLHRLDWLARSARAARLRRGAYGVFVVAWDESGLESKVARGSFSLRRL
jgi:hypothetical protein